MRGERTLRHADEMGMGLVREVISRTRREALPGIRRPHLGGGYGVPAGPERRPPGRGCSNVTGGPQSLTWLANEVPTALTTHYRVAQPGAAWSVMGHGARREHEVPEGGSDRRGLL